MRQKENAQDYRYFPEPDIPVFRPDDDFLRSVDKALVELPLPRSRRLEKDLGLSREQAESICEEKEGADYFEETLRLTRGLDPKAVAGTIANRILQDIKHILNKKGLGLAGIGSLTFSPARLASLAGLEESGAVSVKIATRTLEAAIAEDRDPADIVRERGWEILSDPVKIAEAVKIVETLEGKALAEAREAAAGGNAKRRGTLAAFLVGKVLEQTGGRADPKIAGAQIAALIDR
jgi:aspartyl-tRNA(Asn)/glutamyl-tRNA(Gln) amidotransferase subunit B